MPPIEDTLQAYAEAHTEAASPLLTRIEAETHAHATLPQMLSGHLQGRVLATFSHMIRPHRILEVGTYTGYATLCLAEALPPTGLLHTIDNNASLEPTVREYLAQSGRAHQIKYHIGQAAAIIPQIKDTFDLVFIDADKKNNALYYSLVFDQVQPGGFIVVDNVLWKGRVVAPQTPVDKRTQAIMDFNTQVHQDPRVENVLFPIRDGLMVLRKK